MDEQESESPADITMISTGGDLILDLYDEKLGKTFSYRADIVTLRKASAYFDRLLDPNKFGEGAEVSKKLEALKISKKPVADAPVEQLPRVRVADVGRISKVNSIKPLFGDLLKILHGHDILANKASPGSLPMPLSNVANLAVVADRFDALPAVSAYVRQKRILEHIDARNKAKGPKPTEERLRQRMLLGLLFDHPSWVSSSSQSLVLTGSMRWKSNAKEDNDLPLWWDLPMGIEDELITRRDYILDTLQSLSIYFTSLYTSGVMQCRLGYSSSRACDSYQLGEMIKFFKKNNLIKLGPVLTGQDEADPYEGDIDRIIDVLKSTPMYSMDEYHSHCGLRLRLMPIVEALDILLHTTSANGIGICRECWQNARAKYAWSDAKRPVSWRPPVPRSASSLARKTPGVADCPLPHGRVRDMFMAVDRDWAPKEEINSGISFGKSTPFLKFD